MISTEGWYIVQRESGHCDIVSSAPGGGEADENHESGASNESSDPKTWGPFSSQGEAIARRVGLIRAGKCKPKL